MAKTKKLVRDKIPEIITADGDGVTVRVLDYDEYEKALFKKIKEEVRELEKATTPNPEDGLDWDAITDEAADVLEALKALAGIYTNWHRVEERAEARRLERGGFDKRLYLETIHRGG